MRKIEWRCWLSWFLIGNLLCILFLTSTSWGSCLIILDDYTRHSHSFVLYLANTRHRLLVTRLANLVLGPEDNILVDFVVEQHFLILNLLLKFEVLFVEGFKFGLQS